MLLLDENILPRQRQLLRERRIPTRQIGSDIGRSGMLDDEILALLPQLRRPTLFTRDLDFSHRRLCHQRYCLVYLDVSPGDVALTIRRMLHHPRFRTQAERMGWVLNVSSGGIAGWQLHNEIEQNFPWPMAH